MSLELWEAQRSVGGMLQGLVAALAAGWQLWMLAGVLEGLKGWMEGRSERIKR